MTISVTVAIVNWNTAAAARAAATAYLASTGVDVEVTIVDNGSAPGDLARLRESVPAGVTIDLAGRNLGYGAAVNRGLAAAATTLVCASNADVRPEPDMLARLADVALADERIGLAAPRLTGATRAYHAHLPAAHTLPLRALIGAWGHRTVADPPPGVVVHVEQPGGACLVVRAETWRAVGGFDTGFFLWFEDVDLARRMRASGHVNVVVGSAVADHHGAEAFVQVDPRLKQAIRLRSLNRYVGKHHPRLASLTRVSTAAAHLLRVRSRDAAAEARRLEART